MPQPIALSLAGNGRVVLLSPETVRQAFFQFLSVNRLMARQLHRFNLPRCRSKQYASTALDRLFRRRQASGRFETLVRRKAASKKTFSRQRAMPAAPQLGRPDEHYLVPSEIGLIEREMNRMLLEEDAALVYGESLVQTGHVPNMGVRGSMRKALYVIRCGIIFELEPLTRDAVLQGSTRDLILESHDRKIRFLRYERLAPSRKGACVELFFRDRFDLGHTWATPLSCFSPRRLFAIRRIAPYEGFFIREWSPLADGVTPRKKEPLKCTTYQRF